MLDTYQFANAVEILTTTHPTPNMEKRISGLYHFFKKEDFQTIRKAAEQAAYELERFPTPSQFAVIVKNHRTRDLRSVPLAGCDFCNGAGVVTVMRREDKSTFIFRCHCANAARFEKIPPWISDRKAEFMLLSNTYQDLHDNPDSYTKGLQYLKNIAKEEPSLKMPLKIAAIIEQRIETANRMKKDMDEVPF